VFRSCGRKNFVFCATNPITLAPPRLGPAAPADGGGKRESEGRGKAGRGEDAARPPRERAD
jgi:hypothetical protein